MEPHGMVTPFYTARVNPTELEVAVDAVRNHKIWKHVDLYNFGRDYLIRFRIDGSNTITVCCILDNVQEDAYIGIAKKHPEDVSNPRLGRMLALRRALSEMFKVYHNEAIWR